MKAVVAACQLELLIQVKIFGERRPSRMLHDYIRYYHEDRCHLGFQKNCPVRRTITARSGSEDRLMTPPRTGVLHDLYEWHEAV
jgi:hypothetical protein